MNSPEHRTIRLVCLSEAVAPITHMDHTEGNEAIVAREPVVARSGRIASIPFLSGNALRNRLVRSPGMLDLIDRLGLRGRLSLPGLNFLLHGGAITQSTARVDPKRIADWHRLFPLGKLLGGCLPDQILAGSLLVGRGLLVCEENRGTIEAAYPEVGSALPTRLRSGESFVSGWKYVRGDASGSGLIEEFDLDQSGTENMMYFTGQCVIRGSVFIHDFTITSGSVVDLGALVHAIVLWQAGGGVVGGAGSRGHGRLATGFLGGVPLDLDSAREAYLAHVEMHRDEAIAWFEAAFRRQGDEPAKKAGRSRKPTEPSVAAKDGVDS